MPISVSPEDLAAAAAAFSDTKNTSEAARRLGIPRSTLQHRLQMAAAADVRPPTPIVFPEHPADDIPTEDLIRQHARRAEQRFAAAASRVWQPIKIGSDDPYVLAFVGDPHLDDDGCDWPMLLKHIELMKRPGVYAVNIGDTTNNWAGKLARLYANQDTSKRTARKYAKWFLAESGINWLLWLMGNHDMWDDGGDILRLMNTTPMPMEDWEARFTIVTPNGFSLPVWASHDFKGRSMYNKLHGPMRAARERRGAMIYVCGHTHEWAVTQEELPDSREVFWAMRARGYKVLDPHAVRYGFDSKRYGATVAAVVDPRAEAPFNVHCFADLETAVRYRDSL